MQDETDLRSPRVQDDPEWTEPSVRIVKQTTCYTLRVVDPSLGDVPEWYEIDLAPECSAFHMAEAIGLIPADYRPDGTDTLDTDNGTVTTMFFTRRPQP